VKRGDGSASPDPAATLSRMERIAHKCTSFEEAARWDREQQWAMIPDERLAIAKELRERVFGKDAPDVRQAEREK
jgi:hypothetical protein